ncbi:hypothetical protein HDV05_000986, partial [Chytridiales sp. JEL 0842]
LRNTTNSDHATPATPDANAQVVPDSRKLEFEDSSIHSSHRHSGSAVQFGYDGHAAVGIKKTAQMSEANEVGGGGGAYVRRKSAQFASFSADLAQRQHSVSIPLSQDTEESSDGSDDESSAEEERSTSLPSLPHTNDADDHQVQQKKRGGSTFLGSMASFKSGLSNTMVKKGVGRSKTSVNTENTMDGQLGVMTRFAKAQWEKFEGSYIYRKSNVLFESISYQLTILSAFHTLVAISIFLVAELVVDSELPNIGTYNIVHELVSVQAKLLMGSGWALTQVVAKAFMAQSLVKSHNGVQLIEVAAGRGYINPPTTRTMRWLFGFSLLLCEVTLFLLQYEMNWTPVRSSLGAHPCTPVSYPTKPKFLDNLGTFLQGDSNFAQVYMYGLPLADGIVGGWAAWPLAAPSPSFSVEADGVLFAANAICAEATLAPPANKTKATQFRIQNQELWDNIYLAAVEVRMPGGTHDRYHWRDSDIVQKCQISLMTGLGRIKYGFVVDEWNMATGGQVESVQVGNLLLTQRMEPHSYYGSVAKELKPTSLVFSNLTSWIGEAVNLIYNNTSYESSQGATSANIHQWASESDGD